LLLSNGFFWREGGFEGVRFIRGALIFFSKWYSCSGQCLIVSGAVAERMKLWSFLIFLQVVNDRRIYPMEGNWDVGPAVLYSALYCLGDLAFH